jgi:rhomboid protease GluP
MLRSLGADFGFAPVVIGTCVTLWLVTLLASVGSGTGMRVDSIMSAFSPSQQVLFVFGASGAYPVFGFGRWWTVMSAGWLHAGLLHILMNMYWLRQMGPAITDLMGPARTVIIYTVGGIAGFALSSFAGAYLGGLPIPFLRGASMTVGASAPLFGLIGALYHYGRTTSNAVKQQAMFIMAQAFVFGLLMPGIDNYAHLGGFAGGYLTSAFLNPMTRERGDHMIIAIVCLGATFLAIAASILTALPLLAR